MSVAINTNKRRKLKLMYLQGCDKRTAENVASTEQQNPKNQL